MRKFHSIAALCGDGLRPELQALFDRAAIAQTVGSRNPSAPPPSTNPDKQLLPETPVGHRQPRVDQVPSEKNLMDDPNDPINHENAALDRMVKGICPFAALAKY